jgi:predicted regulator of Ras-like GTPase activity (Roadblock/LC7/MglB family)
MLKRKTSADEAETALTNQVVITSVDGENSAFASLSASLAEIRKLNGVIGYILRSNTSAILDFTEPDKITENAILSSQIHDSCQEITKQFNLGEMENVLVEGENVKVLNMSMGENNISVFMEKNATHSGIIKRILM